MAQISSKDFWISEWQRAADGSHFRSLYPDDSFLWDMFAHKYDSGMGKDSERVEKVFDILNNMDFWSGGTKRILDIGSGTGSFAIPLATRGGQVDALDSSEEMNNVLREKCEADKINGIRILAKDFRDHGVADNSYDLVVGSMNPCLYEPQNFLKMLSLSRDVVVYIGITGGNKQAGEKTLAELLTGRPAGHNSSNHILYPFNLLLSMGVQPTVDYIHCQWEHEEEPEQAKKDYYRQFEHLKDTVQEFDQIISDYVDRHIENGMFVQRSSCTMGVVAARIPAEIITSTA